MSLRKILQAADKAADQAATREHAATLESTDREFVRQDVASSLQQRNEADTAADPGASIPQSGNQPIAENLNGLIQRVAGASANEIDRVILELQGVRNMLRGEGERLSREIASYAGLNHAAMTAMKVIGDSLEQWKNVDPTRPTGATPPDHARGHVIALPGRAS